MFFAELVGELAGTELREQCGQATVPARAPSRVTFGPTATKNTTTSASSSV